MKTIEKSIVFFGAAIFILIGFRFIWGAILYDGEDMTVAVIISSTLFVLAYGLFRQFRWALRGTAFILVMFAITLPVGIFNPFTAGDYMAMGMEPPSIAQTLLWLIPVEILLLAIVYLIDPRKDKKNKEVFKNDNKKGIKKRINLFLSGFPLKRPRE